MRTADRKLGDLNRRCPSCSRQVERVVHTIWEGTRAVPCGCRVTFWFDGSGVVNVRSS